MELSIGKVLRTKGLNGELIVVFFNEKLICKERDVLFFEKQHKKIGEFKVKEVKFYKIKNKNKLYIIKLEEVDNIEKAQLLKSSYIIKNFDKLPSNFFLKKDLIGNKVVIKGNEFIGYVLDIIRVKEGYSLLLVRTKKKYEIFIPFIKEIIENVDVERKKILVRDVEGIVDVV